MTLLWVSRQDWVNWDPDCLLKELVFFTGTTLNLLKFPIIKATYRHLALRIKRLKKTMRASAQNDMLRKEKWRQYRLNKYAIREGM